MGRAPRRATSPADVLLETERAFKAALRSEKRDYRGASEAQQNKVKRNVKAAETLWLRAGRTMLDATAAGVTTAYALAVEANNNIDEGRAATMDLASRIRATGAAITAASNLVKAAKKK